MSNKKGIKYNSKSKIILNKYTPEEIQKLLISGLTKKAIVANLGVQFKAFDRYIEEHNLTYKTPSRKKPDEKINIDDIFIDDEPLNIFKKLFEERKLKRTLKELKEPYN
jgi:hypothetical protein